MQFNLWNSIQDLYGDSPQLNPSHVRLVVIGGGGGGSSSFVTVFVGMSLTCLCARFHMLTSSCFLLNTMKLKATY